MEKTALLAPGSYSKYGPACVDWVSACNTLRDGPKQAQVFSILHELVTEGNAVWYTYLSTRTDGTCVQVKSYFPKDIAKGTINLLPAWMGVEKAPFSIDEDQEEDFSAELLRYISVSEIECLDNEKGMSTHPYFWAIVRWIDRNENITRVKLTGNVMKEFVPRKTAPMPDFAEEIASLINSVPDTEMYPCVFLDPTLSFASINYGAEERRKRAISDLIRSELLQIGRSCNPDVLRRYGAILTRLTIVSSARDMPDYISNTNSDHVPKIPLVLVTGKYNEQFWKVLLHTIEPGAKLSLDLLLFSLPSACVWGLCLF
ncbi:hypothetical protein CBS147332_3862 [Penicillium roqueforti]|nr:hypothetical protein CBS147332_3862 [Penicillium roqueforti]KAI3112018.1 hypothetical protein CBS147331_4572 [Penicillium roqueforti]